MKRVNVSFLSKDKILFGLSLEVQKHCEKLDKNAKPIIKEYKFFSIGIVFFTIEFVF